MIKFLVALVSSVTVGNTAMGLTGLKNVGMTGAEEDALRLDS